MDNSVKILADFIVQDKSDVISFLNEKGYARLPQNATVFEVNEAVAKNILDESFVRELSGIIFEYRGVVPEAAQQAAEASSSASNVNPATWITKVVEIGAGLYNQARQESNERAALQAQYNLRSRQIESELELAKQRAQQDFAFELRKAQEESLQDNTQRNLILLVGVVGILAITFYAVRRGNR